MTKQQLKPCPHCESESIKIATECGVVECSDCHSYSCSVDAWNTRAYDSQQELINELTSERDLLSNVLAKTLNHATRNRMSYAYTDIDTIVSVIDEANQDYIDMVVSDSENGTMISLAKLCKNILSGGEVFDGAFHMDEETHDEYSEMLKDLLTKDKGDKQCQQ